MRTRAILSAASLAAAALAVVPLSAARANTSVTLPLTHYGQMVVDSVHHHLFFSQGSTSQNGILVTDFSGKTVTTITGQTGVMGITLSPDGSTLYAAVSGAHAVTAISTATLQQTAAYSLGAANTPYSVAVQSGKLWVSYDTGTAGSSTIGDFDLSAASPALEAQSAMGGWYSAPIIAADPSDTANVLIAMQPGISPAAAASFDTAADPVTLNAKKFELTTGTNDNCDNMEDLAVTPGGAQFIPACGAPYAHFRYSTADLSYQGSYASTYYPSSIAIASGTGLVAAGVSNTNATHDVYVYKPGSDKAVNVYNTGSGGTLAARGLALTANGSELFAVTGGTAGGYKLNVYDGPGKPAPALSISITPKSATYRPVVHITVHLGTANGDKTVSVYAKPAGSTRPVLLKTGTVNSAGTMKLSFSAAHNTTFSAVFAGDAVYQAKTVTAGVKVAAKVTVKIGGYYASKAVGSVTYRLFHRTKKMNLAISVAPNKHGECVKLDLQEQYRGKWYDALSACIALPANSIIAGPVGLSKNDVGYHYRVRAVYQRGKDTTNLSANSGWQYFIVQK